MTRGHLVRYAIRDLGRDHRIWDHWLEDYCGLPAEDGRHETLSFPSLMGALDWLHKCSQAGLRLLGHPGITIKVYAASDGSMTARHLKTVAEPPGRPLDSSRFPLCECVRCRPRT